MILDVCAIFKIVTLVAKCRFAASSLLGKWREVTRETHYRRREYQPWYKMHRSGAPNDGFLLNTLKKTVQATESSFKNLEMHYKRRYKICISSLILGELWSFEITNAFKSIIFPKTVDEIGRITKVSHFVIVPNAITCLNPRTLGSLFSTKKQTNLGK